ncbi:hypothetical protein ABIA32_005065 [Streptacidiphilus sp. MAP12-20]|uniref:hypothetical protein n=1 Tax=Streptacidiphilus sp. MAP12-20 TaxID=3156299 RepID=UPI003518069F
MYGPPPAVAPVAPAPPARRGAAVGRALVWLVVAIVLIGGVGILACVPLAVLAVRSRMRRDLWLAAGALAYSVVGCVAVYGQHDSTHPGLLVSFLSLGMLGQGIAATAYYIASDVRRARVPQPQWQPSYAPGPSPAAYGVPPQAPAQPAAPMPAQSYRLGQVRAELDELSDYLRKEEGR